MTKPKQSGAFLGHRFPPEIIAYTVWAYHRFPMSLRDVEDLLAARGIMFSYEAIRAWVANFGSQYAKVIRRDLPKVADKWHLNEVVLPINGKKYWLWRAVDSNGDVLDILVQSQRNKRAADRFFRNLFKAFGKPRVMVTDKLQSYSATLKKLGPGIEHQSHRGLNNRPCCIDRRLAGTRAFCSHQDVVNAPQVQRQSPCENPQAKASCDQLG